MHAGLIQVVTACCYYMPIDFCLRNVCTLKPGNTVNMDCGFFVAGNFGADFGA